MTETTTTGRTQRITMSGRTYTFVSKHRPEMDGHDNMCIGHLMNSRMHFAGYVYVMVRNGNRLLVDGPSSISYDAERSGLAQITFSGPLQAMIESRRVRLLATEALRAAKVPFADDRPPAAQTVRILLPGWGDVHIGQVFDVVTGRVSAAVLRAAEAARAAEPERTRDQARADWARSARQTVATADGLTMRESTVLHEAAEILKSRPDLLAEWIEAAQAEGAILGPSRDAVRE